MFDKGDGRPVLHTETQDLSVGGAAVRSDYADVTGTPVTLLLDRPARYAGEVPKLLKLRARVVSTAQTAGALGYRHGLSFEPDQGEAIAVLADLLSAPEAAQTGAQAPVEVDPAAAPDGADAPRAAAGARRLSQLKYLAQLKRLAQAEQAQLAEQLEAEPHADRNASVSNALERACRYLEELAEQLNVVKPAFTKGYSIVGVPAFSDLAWEEGRIHFRAHETPSGAPQYEQVTLYFVLSGRKQLRETRDNPAHEKLQQVLLDNKIAFTTVEQRNARGSVERTTFVFPCEVKATLQLVGNYDTGKLLLRARNVERFGLLEHVLAPEAITEESLDELSGFILGEVSRLGPLLLRNA